MLHNTFVVVHACELQRHAPYLLTYRDVKKRYSFFVVLMCLCTSRYLYGPAPAMLATLPLHPYVVVGLFNILLYFYFEKIIYL